MLNDAKFTLRRILKNKAGTLINVTGLTIGLFVSILLINFFIQESTYDHYHTKADRIHKVVSRIAFSEGKFSNMGISLGTVARDFKARFSQVEEVVRLYGPFESQVDQIEKRHNDQNVLYADYSFISVFDFSIDKAVFQKPSDAIISSRFAEKLSTSDPIGKEITIENISYTISSVVEIPKNTMFQFDILVPIESDPMFKDLENGGLEFETYVLLHESDNNKETIELLKARYNELTSEQWSLYVSDNDLIPLKSVYLSDWVSNRFGNGNEQLLSIIFYIAILVIILAVINYINIQIANNHSRSTELKLKKIMGAQRVVILKQGVTESLFIIAFSGLIALLLVDVFSISSFASLMGSNTYTLAEWPLRSWFIYVFALLTIGVIAGIVPAIRLFSLKSISPQYIKEKKLGRLTIVLVVFQFFVSSSLLSSIFFVNEQMNYMRNHPTGYNSEQVIAIENLSEKQRDNYQLLKDRLTQKTSVLSVSGSQSKPGDGASGQFVYRKDKTEEDGITISHIRTINGYAETLNLEFINGHDFSIQAPDQGMQFILNETAANQLFTPDENPIGKTINMSGREGKIVGVVEDFHYLSFHHKIEPLAINTEQSYNLTMMVRLQSNGNLDETLQGIKEMLQEIDPLYVFDYQFLDEQFDQLYESELRHQELITYSTIVAFSISIIGLLALSIFVINSKMKEIAIRKVLGGSNIHIFSKLSGKLINWIIVGNLISIPAVYYVSINWIQDFIYQLSLKHLFWMIPLTVGITLFVAFAAIMRKLYNTITVNPVFFLRNE